MNESIRNSLNSANRIANASEETYLTAHALMWSKACDYLISDNDLSNDMINAMQETKDLLLNRIKLRLPQESGAIHMMVAMHTLCKLTASGAAVMNTDLPKQSRSAMKKILLGVIEEMYDEVDLS